MRDDEELECGGEGGLGAESSEQEGRASPDRGPGQASSARTVEESAPDGGAEIAQEFDAREASTNEGDDGPERIHANRNRQVQVARTGGRKLFDEAAKAVFLEWFAATCNQTWSAELAGFNYKTVCRHRMNDPAFAEAWDRAEEQGVARLRAKQLETKRRPLKIGVEGDWDAPEMDDIDPILASQLLREHEGRRRRDGPRKPGRTPRVATNAEVRAALVKRLAVYGVRVFGEPPSPSPPAGEGGE